MPTIEKHRPYQQEPVTLAMLYDRDLIRDFGERTCWEVWDAEYDLTEDHDPTDPLPVLYDEVEDFDVVVPPRPVQPYLSHAA